MEIEEPHAIRRAQRGIDLWNGRNVHDRVIESDRPSDDARGQVGDDAKATAAMKLLDDGLNGDGTEANPGVCDFDIFDVKTPEELDAFPSTKAMIEDFFNEDNSIN